MATHIISFRIANDITYAARYESVVNAIRAEAESGTTWDETTSLFVLKSSKSADALAGAVYIGSKFHTTKDTLLVVNTSNSTYATRGEIKYPATLANLFTGNVLARSLIG